MIMIPPARERMNIAIIIFFKPPDLLPLSGPASFDWFGSAIAEIGIINLIIAFSLILYNKESRSGGCKNKSCQRQRYTIRYMNELFLHWS